MIGKATAAKAIDWYFKPRRKGSTLLYTTARRICQAYDNNDVNMKTNGEHWLQSRLSDALVAFDVGANCGEWAQGMLQSAPNSNIYCYEPVIDTYQRLVKAKLGPRAHLFNVGLSSEAGEASINWCPSNPYLSSMYPSTAHSEASDIRVVPITLATGAGEMQRLGLDRIDVLKIDAEGHDLAALRGFSKALQDQRITVVQFEYNWFTLIAGTCLREFFDVLDGYLLCRLLPYGLEAFGYHPDLDDFKQSNWVAISAAVLESGDWRRFHVRPGAGLGGMALERSTVGKRFLDLYG